MAISSRLPGRRALSVVKRTPLELMLRVVPSPVSLPCRLLSILKRTSRSMGKRSDALRSKALLEGEAVVSAPKKFIISSARLRLTITFQINCLNSEMVGFRSSTLVPSSTHENLELVDSNDFRSRHGGGEETYPPRGSQARRTLYAWNRRWRDSLCRRSSRPRQGRRLSRSIRR